MTLRNEKTADSAYPDAYFDTRYRRALMSFFSRRVFNRVEAEDLTQEVLLRLIDSDNAISSATIDAYVFRIATNLVRDRYRRTASASGWGWVPSPSVDGSTGRCDLALVDDHAPDRILVGRDDLAAVMRVLDELGPRTRDIFLLFRTDRMRQKEIAAAFGISVSAVEKHVVKATVHLAKRFGR